MFEIELKAHVKNRKTVIEKLQSFAKYCGAVEKFDSYYKSGEVESRIRKEIEFVCDEVPCVATKENRKIIFTYKKKQLLKSENGTTIEVNDEKECFLSDGEALESFLIDSGAIKFIEKHKIVLSWKFENALFELCTVPPLGDFLEIEILEESDDEATIQKNREKLLDLLCKCGINETCIEEKYYSQMLSELEEKYV